MRSAFALSVAALAGSALASPSYGRPHYKEVKNVHVIVETVVHTVYVTEGYEPVKPTSSPAPVYSAPAKTTVVYTPAPKPTTSAYVAPPAPTSEAPAYTPAPEPTTEVTSEAPAYTPAPEPTTEVTTEAPKPTTTTAAAPAPTDSGYMGVVNEWRAKLGLSDLACDTKLESNSMNTVVEGNGVMKHKLNPGTFGQVLAPGEKKKFEYVFVGGWLCEKPNMAGMDGVCATESKGWAYEGQTGHADILTSANYKSIGCSWYNGIWGCDLA